MSAERLRQILHNVADETRPVPLEEAAMAQSRQMTVRRTMAGAAAAVVLLVAGVVGATAVWSDRGAPPVDPAVSDSPTNPPDQPGETENMDDTVLYYIEEGAGLHTLADNGTVTTLLENEPNLGATANVSPDGRYVSWVGGDFKLKLLDTTTGDQRVLMDYGSDFCQEPVWSVDSYELFVKQGADFGFYDVTTDKFTPLGFGFDACHVQLDEKSGSGDPAIERQYLYVDTAANKLVRVDDEGAKVGEWSTLYGQGMEIIALQSHADGEFYCFTAAKEGDTTGDFGRPPGCHVIGLLDGDTVEIVPAGYDLVTSVRPLGDDERVVRLSQDGGKTMVFVGYTDAGPVWSEGELPGLAGWHLLAWR